MYFKISTNSRHTLMEARNLSLLILSNSHLSVSSLHRGRQKGTEITGPMYLHKAAIKIKCNNELMYCVEARNIFRYLNRFYTALYIQQNTEKELDKWFNSQSFYNQKVQYQSPCNCFSVFWLKSSAKIHTVVVQQACNSRLGKQRYKNPYGLWVSECSLIGELQANGRLSQKR